MRYLFLILFLAACSRPEVVTNFQYDPNDGSVRGVISGQQINLNEPPYLKVGDLTVTGSTSGIPTGIPNGGTANQILVKQSTTDGDATWNDEGGGLPSGGTVNQVVVKQSTTEGDALWQGVAVPTGGSSGHVLTKSSGTSYDVGWAATGVTTNRFLQVVGSSDVTYGGSPTYVDATQFDLGVLTVGKWYRITYYLEFRATSLSGSAIIKVDAFNYAATITGDGSRITLRQVDWTSLGSSGRAHVPISVIYQAVNPKLKIGLYIVGDNCILEGSSGRSYGILEELNNYAPW